MKIEVIKSLKDADKATGLAIVIDVFRAFSTEAYIFANGAKKIIPVESLEEAYALKRENPEYLLVGERRGVKPEGFDFGNGPSEVIDVDFSGRTIIHTTSNGTKGLANARNAKTTLVGSFVVADSIVRYIKKNGFQDISLISTSLDTEDQNEDVLLAYYVRDCLNGNKVDEQAIKDKLRTTSAHAFLLNEAGVPQADIDLCLDFHRFDFIIRKVNDEGISCLVKESL